MNQALVPHLAYPFRFEGGSAAVVEQDAPDEVAQCVEVLLRTREGERLEVPEFGLADLVFQTTFDHRTIQAEIERWEPRAATVLADHPDRLESLIRTLTVRLSVRE